jgi:epoxyqueuosine reductase
MNAREEIEARATVLGFDHLGVCAASPPPPELDRFHEWLARGLHGEMAWIERAADQRLDPSLLLRGVSSILVAAVRYDPPPPSDSKPLSAEVAAYARGEDYHRTVGEMAARLAGFVRERFDARAAEYVDTGPILERLWAARAGVGWIGKNSLVLNRESGSFFFLAVILTDLELPPDEPAVDQCGSCSLCVEACPTGAIVEDRVVDSRLCLSYHTIELRGSFPSEHRAALGTRLFGCDDCQTACPWNRADQVASPSSHLDLVETLTMTLADYTRRFRGSAMKRATYHGLRRNAAIGIGNRLAGRSSLRERPLLSGDARARAIEALKVAARDPEPSVACAARWALAESGTDRSASP